MKVFEIRTPALREAVDSCRDVLNGVVTGSDANERVRAANATINAVDKELKVRLAMPKIAAAEAKMIELDARATPIEDHSAIAAASR